MLTCVFNPLGEVRVVPYEEEADLLASGVWFDCPKKAQEKREKVEHELKEEEAAKKSKEENKK